MNNEKRPRLSLEHTSTKIFRMLLLLSLIFCIFGLAITGPQSAITGLSTIISSQDGLISDYIHIAGIGGAFLNAGLVMIVTLIVFSKSKIPYTGISIATVFLMGGFALFGKNIYNIFPILIGGWLYAKFQKEPFGRYVYSVMFGTTLAPLVTEIAYVLQVDGFQSLVATSIMGMLIGFIIPAVASHTVRVHQGYNLYNVGLAAGLIGLVITSVLRSMGYTFSAHGAWSTQYNTEITILLGAIFAIMLIYGYWLNGFNIHGFRHLHKHSGRAVADFIVLDGLAVTMMNMAVLGLFSTGYVLVIGAHLNGPTVGGILTVVGFGAMGKHLRNVLPIMGGVVIASLLMPWELTEPAMVLAALFSTGLAPIAGQFGVLWGIIAGMIHSAVVRDVGMIHGWMNLYNNGFAAGLICIVLVPIIESLRISEE